MKNAMKMEKTKPENLGLKGLLNLGSGFEKVRVTQVFGFGQTQVANPNRHKFLYNLLNGLTVLSSFCKGRLTAGTRFR